MGDGMLVAGYWDSTSVSMRRISFYGLDSTLIRNSMA